MFRPGRCTAAESAGFWRLWMKINMARNEALAVLHGILDFRRTIDVPGYDVVRMDEGTRFIATMKLRVCRHQGVK